MIQFTFYMKYMMIYYSSVNRNPSTDDIEQLFLDYMKKDVKTVIKERENCVCHSSLSSSVFQLSVAVLDKDTNYFHRLNVTHSLGLRTTYESFVITVSCKKLFLTFLEFVSLWFVGKFRAIYTNPFNL